MKVNEIIDKLQEADFYIYEEETIVKNYLVILFFHLTQSALNLNQKK